MSWIGWLVAASVAVGLGTLLWLARSESARLQAALDQARRAHAQELGEVKASATRQLRAEKTEARHAVQNMAADLLPVADGMDRAIAQVNGDADSWRQGVELVRASLESALARHGVCPVDVQAGEAFAPQTQECISELPSEDDDAPLTIVAVQRRGWFLHERLMRPAEVVLQRVAEREVPEGEHPSADPEQGDGAAASDPEADPRERLEGAIVEAEGVTLPSAEQTESAIEVAQTVEAT